MTAAGVAVRKLLGESPDSQLIQKGVALLNEVPPVWNDDGSIDLIYWFFGSVALSLTPDARGRPWVQAMNDTLIDNQVKEGVDKGSWDPVGAWGYGAGRVYSTSMATLALLGPVRYPPGCGNLGVHVRPFDAAWKAVLAAQKHKNAATRKEADGWVHTIRERDNKHQPRKLPAR